MTTAAVNEPSCPFCDKQGLPILPVRYAIARADRGDAPALPAGFGEGVTSIKLPADTARYTLRLLRSGYLYTYDERRKEWHGYVVNGQSYLYEFNVYAKAPPEVGYKTFNNACKAKNDTYRARCFTVKDAANATRVWVGFSDVAWTADVLKDYAGAILGTSTKPDAADRKQSLQCIDVAAWRGGKTLPHMATFDGLKHVAEFAANAAALQQDTRTYFKNYLPPPYKSPEDMFKNDDASNKAFRLMSPMFRELLHSTVGKPPEEGQINTAAWKFSPQTLNLASKELTALTAWGNAQAKPQRPVMMGLFDPAGIAIELNGLAIQRSVEFTGLPERRWKLETAQLIAGLKVAIGNGAVDAKKENAGRAYRALTAPSPMNAGGGLANLFPSLRKAQEDAAAYVEQEERKHIESHADQIGEAAWDSDYKPRLKPGEWEAYLGKDGQKGKHEQELEGFTNSTLKPLDQSYMGWLSSPAMVQVFKFHYDPKDLRSGESYLELAQLLIGEAGGRQAIAARLTELIQQDPTESEAWLVRALVMNYGPLIQEWKKGAQENTTSSALLWADIADKLHDKLKDIFASAAGGGTGSRYFDKAARLIYQVGGPMIEQLSKEIDKGIGAALPSKMQMGLLGAVAKAGNPDLMVVDLRGMWNRKEAAKTLASLLASIGGGNEHQYRSGVRAVLDGVAGLEGAPRPYHAVLLLDKAKAKALLPGLSGKDAIKTGVAELLTPAQFDAALHESVGKFAGLEVKAAVVQLILSSITLHNAYDDMIKAKPGDRAQKTVNFAGGVIGLVGAMSATAGGMLEKTAWGAAPLSRQFSFGGIEVAKRSGWFVGIGKLLGAIGGVISGALAIKDGWAFFTGNHERLGGALIFSGFTSIALSVAIFFTTISLPTSVVVGLIIAVVMLVVAWISPNKVQEWLERTLYFGKGENKFFDGPLSQSAALEELEKGV